MGITTRTKVSLKVAATAAALYAAFMVQESKVAEIKDSTARYEALHENRDAKMLSLMADMTKEMAGVGKDLAVIKNDIAYIRPRVRLIKEAVQFSGPVEPKTPSICKVPKFGPFSMTE